MKYEMKVVTYNLMCVWDHPKNIRGLTYRAGLVYSKIKKENPDIIGFQEVIAPQLEYLEHMFPEYLFIGQGRNADMMGEGLYIAIKKSVFMLCGMDVFWISPEPYVPATRFEEQSPYPRICVDILVRHKESGKMLRIYDVHLDHEETDAKAKGMKVVLDKISEDMQKIPAEVILLGDFNEQPYGPAITYINEYKDIKLVDITSSIPVSAHDYKENVTDHKIDYIFTSESLAKEADQVKIWDENSHGIFLSDHYPISAIIRFDAV